MEQIKVIDDSDQKRFEKTVNELLKDSWKLVTASCGFINSEQYDFCDYYQAILKREE